METTHLKEDPGKILGIDLGVKNPAVAVSSDGKIKFFGNGRRDSYYAETARKAAARTNEPKKTQILSKQMRREHDRDQKVSREIIDYAIQNNISAIRLEYISSDAANKIFFNLQQQIVMKARTARIEIEYINPVNTSKQCPMCRRLNPCKGRLYKCECGFSSHRDIVGAMNILNGQAWHA